MRPKLLEKQSPYEPGSPEWLFNEACPQALPIPPLRITIETWARERKERERREKAKAKHLEKVRARSRKRTRNLKKLMETNAVGVRSTEKYLRLKWRGKIHSAIRRGHLSEEIEILLGCTLTEFREYISSQFQQGMSWANRSEWHLDHIKPLFVFDLSNAEQLGEAFHYTNYQPLWPRDNCRKGHRI